jgi:hypothetical protein
VFADTYSVTGRGGREVEMNLVMGMLVGRIYGEWTTTGAVIHLPDPQDANLGFVHETGKLIIDKRKMDNPR